MMEPPEVVRAGVFSAQVCVPSDYTDQQAKEFLESRQPCGTKNGWMMRKNGDPNLSGMGERVNCDMREGCVHITFDA